MDKTKSYIKYSTSDMTDSELIIDIVYVAPEERGQGKAKEMIYSAIDYARENGYKTVGLYAEPQEDDIDEGRLIALYKSCGFTSSGDCDNDMTLKL